MNREEKALLLEKQHKGRLECVKQGKLAYGRPPYGYYLNRDTGRLCIIEKQMLAVIYVLENHKTTKKCLAAELNRLGHRTAEGCEFTSTQVKRILDRRDFYEGKELGVDKQRWGRYETAIVFYYSYDWLG